MGIGKRLREVRKSKFITLQEVNRDLGISYSNLAEVEREEHGITADTLKRLADYYKVPIEYLTGYTDSISPDKNKSTIRDEFDLLDISIFEELKKFSVDEKKEILDYIKYLLAKKESK